MAKHFSILFLAAAFLAGCTKDKVVFDAEHPEITILRGGRILYRGTTIPLPEFPRRLAADGVERRDEIPILLGEGVSLGDVTPVSGFMMGKGYSRVFYVTPQHGVSYTDGKRPAAMQGIADEESQGARKAPGVRFKRSPGF